MGFGVFLSLLLIPITFILTKQLIHRCSSCEQQIGTNGKLFHGFNIKDDVVSIKVGEIGFILTKKILFSVILTVLAIVVTYFRIKSLPQNYYGHSHSHDRVFPTTATWQQFLEECSYKIIVTDHQQAHRCMHSYLDKTVSNWYGYVIRVEDYRESLYRYLHHAVQILVKMQPTESDHSPDILLTFDSELVDRYSHILDQINRGQEIYFNATIKSMGNDLQTRHFHARNIDIGQNKIEIQPHIHSGGRYGDSSKMLRKDVSGDQQKQLENLNEDKKDD